jgi:hypothetical protein
MNRLVIFDSADANVLSAFDATILARFEDWITGDGLAGPQSPADDIEFTFIVAANTEPRGTGIERAEQHSACRIDQFGQITSDFDFDHMVGANVNILAA